MRAERQCLSVAQGNALGIERAMLTPCKGKGLTIVWDFLENGDTFALTGRQQGWTAYPGRFPGLRKTLGFQPTQTLYPYSFIIEP